MLRPYHIRAPEKAVQEAVSWRGSLTGNPEPLRKFDQFIHTDGNRWKAYQKSVKELNQKHEEWVARLRAEGFKAAHPNGGG